MRNAAGWLAAFSDRSFSFAGCSALEGLSARQLVWVFEVVEALFRCGPISPSHCLALHWFRSRVGRQELTAGEREGWTVCPSLNCLWRWLVALAVTEFLTLFPSGSGYPSLHGGCSLAVSSAMGLCVVPIPRGVSRVQGGSACGPSTLWRFEVAVPVVWDVGACVVRLGSHVVAPVFRELLCLGSWAQSAHRSCACERDKGLRRVLNATTLVVTFLLPLFGSLHLHGCRVSCAGQSADVGLGKATASCVAFSPFPCGGVVLSDSGFATDCSVCVVAHWFWFYLLSCVKVLPVVKCLVMALVWLWFPWWYLVVVVCDELARCSPSYYPVCSFRHIVVVEIMDQLLVRNPITHELSTMIDGGRNDQRIGVRSHNSYKIIVREGNSLLKMGTCWTGIRAWSWRRGPFDLMHPTGVVMLALAALSAYVETSRDHIDLLPIRLVVDGLHGGPFSASWAVLIPVHIAPQIFVLGQGLDLVLELVAL
ncbi:hypothetical protein Taro_034708 [Colocasia esculenta]|uniref:Uncharacterized protein n=1 Tax=Colocasia esculenta TaxID=4460 RepID=A0A843W8E0_COLES|nr:hypothetical protein [Colocasia esculenta]